MPRSRRSSMALVRVRALPGGQLLPLILVGLAAACSSDGGSPSQKTYTREQLMNPETCKECHADHYTEWSGSMHAYAALDPVFRAMNARGQRETHGALGDFCVKCHAPMAVRDHKTTDGTNLDTLDPAYQGITCYFCHQVTDVQGTHNSPLVLANDTTMRGPIRDPVKNEAHIGAYSVLHDDTQIKDEAGMDNGSKLCGSCHDIVVPGHFSGATDAGAPTDVALERTFEEWTHSLFSKPLGKNPNPEACSACHMAKDIDVPVTTKSGLGVKSRPYRHHHDFPGVDVALTDFPEKDAQREAVLGLLEQTFVVTLCVDGQLAGNASVKLDNLNAGHNVPSGASQDRRMWIELHAYGKDGSELYSSGAVPPGRSVTSLEGSDPNLWELRDVTLDRSGAPAHMFWDVARVDRSNPRRATIPASATLADLSHVRGPYLYRNPDVRRLPRRVTLTLHVQPVGRDVLDSLVESGDLAPAASDAGPGGADGGASVIDAMPTFDVIPNKGDGGVTTTLVWTPEIATDGYTTDGTEPASCVSTGKLQ